MKLLLTLGLGLLAMAVGSVVVHVFGFSNARVEISTVLVVYACLSLDTTRAALASFAGGYLFDLMSGAPTGLFALSAMLTFVICRVVVVMVDVRGGAAFAALCAMIDGLHQLIAYGLLAFFTGRSPGAPTHAALYALPATCALTALAALLLHPSFRRLDRAFDREESSGFVH